MGAFDWLVFTNLDSIAKHLDKSRLAVTEAVFGVLLAALAVQLVLQGLADLGIGVGASIWALLTGSNAGLMVVSLCCIGAFGIILVLALEGLFQAFTSATWTLAYRQMIDLDAAREESAEVEEPEDSEEEATEE